MNSQARCVCDKDNEYGIVRKFSYCEICVKYERHVNVNILVYKMQVRQGESLWSMLVKQTLSFFTFSYLKSVMSLNGLSFVSAGPAAATVRVSSCGAGNSRK